jgi:hypothetical protein
MGVIYATIAIGTIGYGHFLYKKRIRLIKEKYAGHFGRPDVSSPQNCSHRSNVFILYY